MQCLYKHHSGQIFCPALSVTMNSSVVSVVLSVLAVVILCVKIAYQNFRENSAHLIKPPSTQILTSYP
ncbi:hypothetical protein X975_13089, partial [Stegodyphus mimosarum]